MARPVIDPNSLVSSMEGWDAILRDFIARLVTTPYPVPQYANLAALPTASDYTRCLACTIDTNKLYFSNGTVWKEVTLA